ncbi:MAG: VWA domain-containing protein [Akkermansiaceae bacterium]|nr:VWA domain-containing protein [Akkermansiaceae bacterium]
MIAGGFFTSAGEVEASNIAKWDGTAWSALGSGINGRVDALEVSGLGYLYAGGNFTSAGGQPANHIASWNGVSWSPLGTGMNAPVSSLIEDANLYLHAGGQFTTAGGVAANHVAKWNPRFGLQEWTSLGTGIDAGGGVNALALDLDGNLYVGGNFTGAGGLTVSHLARWDGTAWDASFPGLNWTVTSLALDAGGKIHAAGLFSTAGGVPAKGIASWDGTTWSQLGGGIDGTLGTSIPWTLAADLTGRIILGGQINSVGGVEVNGLAVWKDAAWSTLGAGPDLPVNALAFDSSGNLYVGGQFTRVADISANHIARWNGSKWEALGTGLNGTVHALAVDSNDLIYAAGEFTTAAGKPAQRIAVFDGTTWSSLKGGLNGTVFALAVDADDNVYAAGQFTWADGLSGYGRIAKWNGATWEKVGLGMNGPVRALAVDPSGIVYAGGEFTTAGGGPAKSIASWNGSAWNSLGGEMDAPVHALTIDAQGSLIVGGDFLRAGSPNAYGIARWDGAAWHDLSTAGVDPSRVRSLAADPLGNIYAGGQGGMGVVPGGVTIAKWNGLRWSEALGSGSSLVSAMALAPDGALWAGGDFRGIGVKPLGYLAHTTSPLLPSPCGGERWQVGRTHSIVWKTAAAAVKLEYSTDNGAAWALLQAAYPGDLGTYDWIVPNAPSREALVRVTELGGEARVATSAAFDIADLDLTNLANNAVWQTGVPRAIAWTSASLEKIDLQVSTDGGQIWTTIARSLPAESGPYNWTPTTSAIALRIRAVDSLPGSEVEDTAAGVFRIKSLALTVFAEPLALIATSPFTLSWTSGGVETVDLAYSKDGGATWIPIVAGAPARIPLSKTVGTYEWMVPFDPGMDYRLRVSDSDVPEIRAESTALFSIEPHELELLGSPGSLTAGSTFTIRWNGEWSENVRLEYAMDGTETWCPIADSVPAASGEFEWIVPFDKLGSGFRIRITDLAYPLVSDQSDVPFSIVLPSRFARLHGVDFFDQAPFPYLNVLFHAEDMDHVGIDDLHPAELRISENGSVVSEAERIVLLKRRDQLDYTMKTVLMLDNSTSITAEEKPKVLDAARTFINNKLPDQQISIYYFSFAPIQLQGFTTDKNLLLAAINALAEIPRVPTTNLWGAILAGLDQWDDEYFLDDAQRGVVVEGSLVVLTDGDHNTDPLPISTVLDQRNGKRIITVAFGEPETIKTDVLSQLGNGGFYQGADADSLEGLFLQIQDNLVKFANSFYWLGYATPKRGPFVNTLEVGLTANTNTGADAVIVEEFSSEGFTQFIIPGIVVNPTPLNPFGVNTLTIPSLGSEPVTIQTTFTFAAEPYEFEISSPELLAIRPTDTLFVHEFDATAFPGATTTVLIRDPVNGYEKTLTVEFVASSPFAVWAESLGLAGAEGSPTATPFADSYPNLLRYAMGIAAVPEEGSLPETSLEPSAGETWFVLAYQKSKNVPEVDIVPQVWAAPGNWSEVPTGNRVRVADRDANTESWEIRYPVAGTDKLLLRLEGRMGE